MKITGNTLFIPGATSGIGLGLALRLAEAGNTVIIGGRRAARLAEITAAYPALEAVEIDVTDPASIQRAAATVTGRHPELNVLITMAGIMLPEDLHAPDFLPTAEVTVTTNLLGTLRLVAAFLPQLASRPDGVIMTVSSGLAFVPLPAAPTYSATKAAIHAFTESLRVQLADTDVQVIELVPPAVRTDLFGQRDSDRAMPLEDFLGEVMKLIETQPEAAEFLVERVGPLREAVANGSYPRMLAALSAHRS